MTQLVLFDDATVGDAMLSPLGDLRASFELRTGAVTTAERLSRQLAEPVSAVVVPRGLDALVAMRSDALINALPMGDGPFLFVNGRLASFDLHPPHEMNTADVDEHGAVIAALLARPEAEAFLDVGCAELPDSVDVEPEADVKMLRRPWHLIERFESLMMDDLAAMKGLSPLDCDQHPMVVKFGDYPVLVGKEVHVDPMTIFKAVEGPIVLDDNAEVNAHSVIYGPCYVGRDSTLHHRSDIGRSAIGPGCKLGGEISKCVVQGNSNKGHGGYLGYSYLGEWVNLGAATVASNLKNTYGPVAMQCSKQGEPEVTNMQFLGAILGDHVKTAIGTRLMTGSCVGTGAMIARSGYAPKCVEPFAFLTDAGQQRYILEKFVLVADRMMQRRGRRVTGELVHRFAQLMADG